MQQPVVESINQALKTHACGVLDWEFSGLVKWLHEWAERFVREFALEVPVPAIAVAKINRKWLGCYRNARNALGLYDEITIQASHAIHSARWEVLGTLLHELLHEWEYVKRGRDLDKMPKRNLHDAEFRGKAAALGLEVTSKGVTSYPNGDTPFRALLAREGVDLTEEPPLEEVKEGHSKLHLWECKCTPPTKLRVGRKDVRVQCLECSTEFVFVK